ncbi:DUF2959 domain-containing protein [Saccharobesus litoralis]|uniref:DUF2959 domain-containing protein n=1 Tax=Saccharobesus litoralis TaxID=2172099 RepID=A0A2S0VQ53_9ALTE|nr:DUF2959 domain-containing protein [Saccharobesus litoralis]AWB66343.1 DUF2959 domain-containing protein [Saccharobesus litoralis]AWB68845.1 DUF2959 domain-containing protein [Saccharobesus litoralis]
MIKLNVFCLVIACLSLSACQTAYYSAMEKVGIHKREIMVDRIEDAQASQKEVQQEFQSALDKFRSVVEMDGGELEKQYDTLKATYDDAKSAADDVSKRIDSVEDVADALFDEWQDELDQYSSAKLKRQSQDKLKKTERQYQKLIKNMRRTEQKMAPFLAALNDNVLYLKHNLNAKAIGALKGELSGIQREVTQIIDDINVSIEESNRFIKSLQ